jgi:hypothetical protein
MICSFYSSRRNDAQTYRNNLSPRLYGLTFTGTRVWSSTNAYTGATQVHSREVTDPQLLLTIYDAKTKNSVWSTIDHRRLARREKNREKEMINSAERLVDELKTRASIPQ